MRRGHGGEGKEENMCGSNVPVPRTITSYSGAISSMSVSLLVVEVVVVVVVYL
jgi:hypothetical protein